ncbi:hypothetical protein RHSIM_Rhsim02G0245600 [Rhododendron simsii]|uniref:Ubiquitin-like protease family profile domain-containing protein n=1 Tax=Rhododendron simsii TaxID=118357 RepID=A0A834HN70_RHOSS|nr:hypothetical protein RHSIM_Rhsim02G0245600 [Rhododendron simsii]
MIPLEDFFLISDFSKYMERKHKYSQLEISENNHDEEDFLHIFKELKEYMVREHKYSQLEISENSHDEGDFLPDFKSTWRGSSNILDLRLINPTLAISLQQDIDHSVDWFIPSVCASHKVRLSIRRALHKLIFYPELQECLVQFWAPTKTKEGRTLLTTQYQPFALGKAATSTETNQLCKYRMGMCREYNEFFYADAESGEEQLGLPGRVFLNKLPESNPEVKCYTRKEYPQRDLALRCEIKGSWALPVFEQSSHTCIGVLEIACLYTPTRLCCDKEFHGRMYDIFQEFGLRCFDGHKHYKMQYSDDNKALRAAFEELNRVKNDEKILTRLSAILRLLQNHFKTFKLASGQGLGEALSVEVIDFQYGQRSHSIQMIPPASRFIPSLELEQDGGVMLQQVQQDQPSMDAINNGMYVVSETQNYNFPCLDSFKNGKVTTQLDSSDQPSMDPSSNGQNDVTVERNILVVPSSKERKRKMQDRKHKKAGVRIEVSLEEILECSNMKREDAARELKGLSVVPTVHTTGGVWLDAHFSYTPTIEEEETINKCMQDGSFRGEFVDGCWISNITVMEYSEMLDHHLSHCHFFGPNVVKNFKEGGRLLNTILLPKTEKIFFPILRDRHWMLLVIDVKKKHFLWLDSMRCEREKKYSEDFAQAKRMRRTICLELKKWDIIPQCPLVDYNFLYIQERKKNELNEKLHKDSTAASRDDEVFLVSETSRKVRGSSS